MAVSLAGIIDQINSAIRCVDMEVLTPGQGKIVFMDRQLGVSAGEMTVTDLRSNLIYDWAAHCCEETTRNRARRQEAQTQSVVNNEIGEALDGYRYAIQFRERPNTDGDIYRYRFNNAQQRTISSIENQREEAERNMQQAEERRRSENHSRYVPPAWDSYLGQVRPGTIITTSSSQRHLRIGDIIEVNGINCTVRSVDLNTFTVDPVVTRNEDGIRPIEQYEPGKYRIAESKSEQEIKLPKRRIKKS